MAADERPDEEPTALARDPMGLRMGDVLRLRKPHPCGGTDWEVVRLGGDIGLCCLGCRRRVILDRPTLRRRMRAFVSRGVELDPAVERALYGRAASQEDAGAVDQGDP